MSTQGHQPPAMPEQQRGSALTRWLNWSRQTVLFAVAVSLFIHAVLIAWAALTIWSVDPAAAAQGDGEVPLAVVAESELSEILDVGLASEIPTLEELEQQELSTDDLNAPLPESDLTNLEMTDVGDVTGAGDVDTDAGGAVFESDGGARFFGVEARGSRFAYVLDVSGSMQEDQRWPALRGAVNQSVRGLQQHAHFAIFLYSNEAWPLGTGDWVNATDRAKARTINQFNTITPQGGTAPIPAFELVFRLEPKPDAIYFMTDGVFASRDKEDIVRVLGRLNRADGRRVPIHCITLIEDGSAEVMERIARMSGGTYTHIAASGGSR